MRWLVAVLFVFPSLALAAVGPKLFLTYSPIFDTTCSQLTNYKIQPEWRAEAQGRVPEFQAAWDGEADKLMQTLFDQLGRSYSRKEMTVTLSVCKTPSISNPFLINVQPWMKSVAGEKAPYPMALFVDTVFHEFIHNYVQEHLSKTTPLLLKYKNEEQLVKGHIHLMAVQIQVYKALGLTDRLKVIGALYEEIGGSYLRAWEIVTKIEGHDAFIKEFPARL